MNVALIFVLVMLGIVALLGGIILVSRVLFESDENQP